LFSLPRAGLPHGSLCFGPFRPGLGRFWLVFSVVCSPRTLRHVVQRDLLIRSTDEVARVCKACKRQKALAAFTHGGKAGFTCNCCRCKPRGGGGQDLAPTRQEDVREVEAGRDRDYTYRHDRANLAVRRGPSPFAPLRIVAPASEASLAHPRGCLVVECPNERHSAHNPLCKECTKVCLS
jgi:hypothetical protein